nr:MAG TPA: hypothetical protein [Caudoviricetes sp.]
MVTSCSIAKNKSTPTLYPRKVESREYSFNDRAKNKDKPLCHLFYLGRVCLLPKAWLVNHPE